MTKISNYHLNTHFTALKQLPTLYQGKLQIAARNVPANTLGLVLGNTKITVPAGIYVDNIILRVSLDGGVNHLSPQIMHALGEQGYFYTAVNQINNSEYELIAKMENYSNSTLSLPACTVEAFLRLAVAPFSQ